MLRRGSTIPSIWSGLDFLLAALLLTSVVIRRAGFPLLVLVFGDSKTASLDARVTASSNALTILYKSCSVVLAALVGLLIQESLIPAEDSAFSMLRLRISLAEVMAFFASAGVGYAPRRANVPLSALHVVGPGLSGGSQLKGDEK